MGQAVKYALLAAALIAVLTSFMIFLAEVPIDSAAAEFAVSVTDIINVAGSFFIKARGLVNLITGVPWLVQSCLFLVLLKPFYLLVTRIMAAIYKWINQ